MNYEELFRVRAEIVRIFNFSLWLLSFNENGVSMYAKLIKNLSNKAMETDLGGFPLFVHCMQGGKSGNQIHKYKHVDILIFVPSPISLNCIVITLTKQRV